MAMSYYLDLMCKMKNNIKKISINHRESLYLIKKDKFKTDLISVNIIRKLNKKEASFNTLLSRLFSRYTKTFQTTKELNTYLEESYGMILVTDVVKYGEYHSIQIRLQFPNNNHIRDKKILEKAVFLISDIIFNEDILSNESYFLQEKMHLINEIKSRVNDKTSYAIDRCVENMYMGEDYANYIYGDIKTLETVTIEELKAHYYDILAHSKVDICIMGNIDFDYSEEIIRKYIKFTDSIEEDSSAKKHATEYIKYIYEKVAVKQAKLILGYKGIREDDELYYASSLAYYILAGGPNSYLFKILREEKSLCYNVFTKSDKFKGSLFIGLGINDKDYKLVCTIIKEVIDDLRQGNIDKKLLNNAKLQMENSIRSLADFPNSFVTYFYMESLNKGKEYQFSIENIIDHFNQVTIEDIKKVYEKIELDTVFLLHGEEFDNL